MHVIELVYFLTNSKMIEICLGQSAYFNKYVLLRIACIALIVLWLGAIAVIIHMKRLADKKVIERTRELNHITNSIHVCVVDFLIDSIDEDFKITYASNSFYDMLGYTKKEIEGQWSYIISHVYHLDIDVVTSLKDIGYYDNFQREMRMVTKEGKVVCMLFNGNCYMDKDSNRAVTGVLVDVTESKLIREKLQFEEERYRVASEITNDILFEYKIKDDMMIFADKFEELYGIDPVISLFSRCMNQFFDSVYYEDIGVFKEYCRALQSGKEMVESEFRLLNVEGEYVWCHTRGKTIYDDKKKPVRVIGKVVNIDLHKKELETLEYKAKRDPLTNIYNKNVTKDLIDQYTAEYPSEKHILMLIDIDDFKSINDTYGHLKGDHVLMHVIDQIKTVFSKGEILGRIGGDEFIAFIGNASDMEQANEKALEIQNAIAIPYEDDEDMIVTSVSIGIAIYPDGGSNYDELLCSADRAMYQVKEKGKNGYSLAAK